MMDIRKRIATLRHVMAVTLLAVFLSMFSVSAGMAKAADESQSKALADPVISSMTWEAPADADLDDPNNDCTNYYTNCYNNCYKNCYKNC